VVSLIQGTELTARFGQDGLVSGSAGCNSYHAEFAVQGQTLTVGPVATTRRTCMDKKAMDQESAFLAALDSAVTWEIRADRLQLRSESGSLAVDLVSALTGRVSCPDLLGLIEGTRLSIQLQDVSRADAPAKLMAEQVVAVSADQIPYHFTLAFDPAEIDARNSYQLRATVGLDSTMLYTTTRAVPVLTRDSGQFGVELVLEPAGE
jgi:uncharacterized lipoprotein YbaY